MVPKSSQHSAEFPIFLNDLIRLNSIVGYVQTTRYTMTQFSLIDDRFRYDLTMFGMCILIRLSRLLNTHIAYEIAI